MMLNLMAKEIEASISLCQELECDDHKLRLPLYEALREQLEGIVKVFAFDSNFS